MAKSWRFELLPLPLIDAMTLLAAFALAYWLRLESGLIYYGSEIDVPTYYQIFSLTLPLCWILFYGCHLYDLQEIFYGTAEYVQVLKGMTFAVLGVIVVSFVLHSQPLSRSWLLIFWIFGILFVGLGRFTFRRIIRPLFRSGRRSERTLVVGANEEARTIARILKETGRLEIVGFLDDFSPVGEKICGDNIVKGSPSDCERIAQAEGVSKLILVPGAVTWETYRDISFATSKWDGLEVLVAPRLSGLFSGSLRLSYIGYVPMLRFQPGYTGGLDKIAKSLIDFSLGLIFLIISLPLMLFFSLTLWLQKGRPIFEGQKVLGLNGRPFITYKFRLGSVPENYRGANGAASQAGGSPASKGDSVMEQILFSSGLDKLPQLIDVLRGHRSLVGPRTIYEPEAQHYDRWLQNILAVKPGMTGLWAMNAACDLKQEIAASLSYIHTWTPLKDLQILCLTLLNICRNGSCCAWRNF